MEDDSIVKLTANGTEIVKRCRSALYQVMEGKFQCTARIQNVEDGADSSFSQIKAAIVPEMKYYKQLSKHLKLVVWKDDLTTHKVDAVVNAANEQLLHGAGLAGALSRAGGPMIQKWSYELIKKFGIVPTGEVTSTQAGNLPCKMIIHAVGPRVPLNPTPEDLSIASGLLEETVQNILKKAYAEKLQSVAIPAISSGIFNFPLTLCADIMVNTVKWAVGKHSPKAGCLEVRLVNHDDPTVQEMVRACNQILGSSDTLPRQNRGSAPTQSSFPNLDLGNVTLYLKKGNIENEATDVIVNTIGGDFNLSKGLVSKALMDKAGFQIQRDLNHFKGAHVYDGDVFVTSACKLKCKAVYHTICPQKESHGNYAEQVLHSVVTSCLKMAWNKGYTSISFPALGTGNLGIDKNVVSHIMTSAVEAFSKDYTGSKIEIYFVIFPKDTETLKAFERKINFSNQGLRNASASTDSKGPGFHKSPEIPEIPFIELLTPPSPEAQQEAKWWLKRTLCLCPEWLEIHNNNIMHLSLEDHKKLMLFQSEFHVEIKEIFQKGHGGFIIKGGALGVGCAALEVEALLCQAQENFARNEEKFMQDDLKDLGQQIETTSGKFYQKELLTEWDNQNWKKTFANYDLDIVTVEQIENPVLKMLFDLNGKRIQARPQRLYQRVSAQFLDLICRIGFQREFAPPKEQKYGAGIYFTNDLEKARYFWPEHEDKYIYFIEAQVLTGKHTLGLQEMIVPPPTASDPLVRYDSVTNNRGVYIIFNGQQAYPEFIIKCQEIKKHRNLLAV